MGLLSKAAPLFAILLAACDGAGESGDQAPAIIDLASVPVPAADGPKLLITRAGVVVRERPTLGAKPLGTLRLGAAVARSEAPLSATECPGGWYAIRPRGFVCSGDEATTNLSSPAAKLAAPSLDEPLPFRYARVKSGGTVTYGRLPTPEEQSAAEPKRGKPSGDKRLGAGANDVPLDETFRPTGPSVVMPDGQGVGEDGYRTISSFFAPDDFALEADATFLAGPAASETRVLKRRSGLAVVGIVDHDGRPFAITAAGRFAPVDRLYAALGTTWHGIDLGKTPLPVAFALRHGIHAYELDKARSTALDEEFVVHEPIALTGKFRTVNGERYFFTADEVWVRHRDIIMIPKRDNLPDFATDEQKWIDVSLANQTLVAWEGNKPVFATLISSGQDRLGDPKEGPATLQGVFHLRRKAITADVDSQETHQAHSVEAAPWAMEFADGFSMVGCYWHGRFGESVGYHDIALSPVDAHFLFAWTAPEVPEGWHGVEVADEEGTIIYVHK